MTVRYYIVPTETVGAGRGPKYFRWRLGTGTIDCPWSMVDYGLVDQAVVAADISDTDAATLAAAADVQTMAFMPPAGEVNEPESLQVEIQADAA